jgi:hypothetical protein
MHELSSTNKLWHGKEKKNSIMSNASKKTSRCNQIAKILIVYHIRNIFTKVGYTWWHFSLSWHVKSILMLIQALQHIDKCKQLHQVSIFLGALWNWKFYKSQKIVNGTTLEISQTQEKPSNPRGFFQNHEPNDIGPKSRNWTWSKFLSLIWWLWINEGNGWR